MEVLSSIRIIVLIASLFGFLGVLFGAFASHILKHHLQLESQQIFEIGVRYQMYHALAIFCIALLSFHFASSWFITAAWSFIVGIIIFSGSLYLLALTGIKSWGAVTPIGGIFLILGWLFCIVGLL
ncbi:hypothetical protein BN1013_00173 [Candidatus Rubidus massiliensis]|nr:hypothetical protein BN1013_00173 [Candidatus Rubidus massiliensis]